MWFIHRTLAALCGLVLLISGCIFAGASLPANAPQFSNNFYTSSLSSSIQAQSLIMATKQPSTQQPGKPEEFTHKCVAFRLLFEQLCCAEMVGGPSTR